MDPSSASGNIAGRHDSGGKTVEACQPGVKKIKITPDGGCLVFPMEPRVKKGGINKTHPCLTKQTEDKIRVWGRKGRFVKRLIQALRRDPEEEMVERKPRHLAAEEAKENFLAVVNAPICIQSMWLDLIAASVNSCYEVNVWVTLGYRDKLLDAVSPDKIVGAQELYISRFRRRESNCCVPIINQRK